jgi:PAS domain S-box-containing protein
MDTAMVVADAEGRIVHWDTVAQELFGHAAEEAMGRPVDLIVPEEYRSRHWDAFHRAMATGECRLDGAATNLPTLHRDGSVRVIPGRFVFLVDPRGTPVGAMAIYAPPAGGEEPWGPIVDAADS